MGGAQCTTTAPHVHHAAAARRRQPHAAPSVQQLPRRRWQPARAIPDNHSRFAANGDADGDEPVADAPSTRQRRGADGAAAPPPPATLKQDAVQSNREVSDKLIDVFQAKQPAEWRKLIAYSKQWPVLAQGVLDRVEERAAEAAAAGDEEAQLALRKLGRRVATVNEELGIYQRLIDKFRAAPSSDWEGLVSLSRSQLSTEFFKYLDLRIKAASDAPVEQDALVALAAQLAALVEAVDRVAADAQALEAAAANFSSLLEVESLEAADRKIDELAAAGKLDPALLLMMAKAYAGAKETDYTREEAKDVMAHLYFKAKESFAQQAPKEVRILKYLLTVESDADRAALLEQAFEPGPQLEGAGVDYLATTPAELLNTVENVLALYDSSRGRGTMAGDAAGLMSPAVIERLRDLRLQIRRKYA